MVGLSNETIDELVSEDVGAWLAKDQKPAAFAKQIERICNLPPDQYHQICQNSRERVQKLDWSNVVDSTVEAYQDILNINLTVSDDDSDMLTSLVRFFSMGDLKDYLLDVIDGARKRSVVEASMLPRVKVPSKMQSWIRVPSSTWLISGLTIVASVIGYLLMRWRGNKEE